MSSSAGRNAAISDHLSAGDTAAAVSLLSSSISNLHTQPPPEITGVSSSSQAEDEDDWEALADRGEVEEVLVSEEKEPFTSVAGKTKRRGRGSFLYKKSCMYSEQDSDGGGDGAEDEDSDPAGVGCSRHGTGHVLVLYDLTTSTRTMELERLFDGFRDQGVAVRWVNDNVALVVFRTPAIANEAQRSVSCPFKIRTIGKDDDLLPQLSTKDLEPPCPRPKTSARTAQRLIAQGMGLKLPTDFGSNELRKQEEARKSRIHARQMMKEDAWGADNPQ